MFQQSASLARLTAEGWNELARRDLVARQEADEQRSAFAVSQATVNAARTPVKAQEANVRLGEVASLQQPTGFQTAFFKLRTGKLPRSPYHRDLL